MRLMTQPFRAVMITRDGIWADGAPLLDWTPAGLLHDAPGALAAMWESYVDARARRDGVLVVDAPAADFYGAGADALRGMWRFGGLDPWTTFTVPGDKARAAVEVHAACLPDLDPDRTPLFALDATPATITAALADWHRATGTPYRMTPGVTGHAMLRTTHSGPYQPRWHWAPTEQWDDGGQRPRGVGNIIWQRAPLPWEARAPYVAGWDVNAAYLAAMGTVEVAWGALEHTGTMVDFDPDQPNRAGYWRIVWAPGMWPYALCPPPISEAAGAGAVWVTTPVMKLLYQAGVRPHVIDSWTAPDGRTRRVFRPLADRLRSIRLGMVGAGVIDPDAFGRTLKMTWAELVGMLNREGGSIYRPDWYDHIVDQNACNMIRKILRIHEASALWPLEVATDALYYAALVLDPPPPAGVKVDASPGSFKPAGVVPMDDYLADRTEGAFA